MDDARKNTQELLAEAVRQLRRPGFDQAFSLWLKSELDFDNLLILAYYNHREPSLLHHHGYSETAILHIRNNYLPFAYKLDPYFQLHAQSSDSGVYRLDEIAPDKFHSSRYFKEYYGNAKLEDELVFVSRVGQGVSVHVALGHIAVSGRKFSAKASRIARTIQPVAQAMVEGNWRGLRSTDEASNGNAVDDLRAALEAAKGIALTPRQAEVALMILQGHSSTSIGLNLNISPQTVKVFRRQIYRKCQISSQAELFSLLVPLL